MKKKLLFFLLLFTVSINAQNPADVDLVVGTGFKGFHNIQAIAIQTDGKIVVGGFFTYGIQGVNWEGRLVRYNIDGSVDTSFEALPLLSSGSISDIAIQLDGKILVSGNFTTMNGENARYLIRLNTDGSKDTSFLASIGGMVRSIALQPDGRILIVGNFSVTINGHLQRYVARLNADGTLDSTFDFGFPGFPSVATSVNKVAVQADGKILVGGGFDFFNNTSQGKLIRFNSDGTKDTSFDIGMGASGNNALSDILPLDDGKILISGGFSTWNGQPCSRLFRLNADGSIDNSFALGVTSTYVSNIALRNDGKIVVLGNFTVNDQLRRIVSLNSDGSTYDTFAGRQPNYILYCLKLQTDGKILIGGYMNEFNGVMKNRLARLHTDGELDTSFNLNTGLNDEVFTIALHTNDKTLIGGDFTTFDGVSQNKIIRINDDGSKDTSFNIGSGFNNSVKKIVPQPDGKILVGGYFTEFNGETANHIIRLNTDGTKDISFNTGTGFDNYVKTIILQPDGKILVGGNFTLFNGFQQNYCVRLNTDGTKDSGFNIETAFNNRVTNLALQLDGKIIAGGNFTAFNGQEQKYLIRLNDDGSKDTSFEIGTGLDITSSADVVRDIDILPDGKIYIASLTSWYNGNNVGRPLRLNTNGTVDESYEHSVTLGQGFINTIAVQQDGKIIVGGTFVNINGGYQNQRRIIRLNADGTKDTSFDINEGSDEQVGGFAEGECYDIVIQPDNKIWVGGSFFNYRTTTSFSAIRLAGDELLSIDESETLQDKILLYPNPVKNTLYLNSIVNSIKIVDFTGKILARQSYTDKIDFSIYPDGLYLIIVEHENGIQETKKIIKQ